MLPWYLVYKVQTRYEIIVVLPRDGSGQLTEDERITQEKFGAISKKSHVHVCKVAIRTEQTDELSNRGLCHIYIFKKSHCFQNHDRFHNKLIRFLPIPNLRTAENIFSSEKLLLTSLMLRLFLKIKKNWKKEIKKKIVPSCFRRWEAHAPCSVRSHHSPWLVQDDDSSCWIEKC